MKLYVVGPVSPRFVAIQSSTNANPIVITTAVAHGLTLADVVTVNSHVTNTNANGTWSNVTTQQFTVPSPTTISINVAGNGVGGATGTVSAPQQIINAPNFPVIPGVDKTKLLVARMLFTPVPFGTATLLIGGAGLNQATFANVFRPINPPPLLGIYDYYDLIHDGSNIFPISEYYIDALKPGTEAVLTSFWLR